MVRVGVTGAAGFLGGALVQYLADRGYEVRGLDNLTGPMQVVRPAAQLLRADVREPAGLDHLVGCQVVLHLAAVSGVVACAERPEASAAVNLGSTNTLARWCGGRGIPLAFASSFAVVGVPDALPITEQTPAKPTHEYARQKAQCEEIVRGYSTRSGVPMAILRMSNVYGRYTAEEHPVAKGNVLNAFAEQAPRGALRVNAPGTQRRDYIHLMDVMAHWEATVRYLLAVKRPGPPVTFNVASGETATVLDLAGRVAARWQALHPDAAKLEISIVPNPRGSIELLQPEFEVSRVETERVLGVKCSHDLASSLDAVLGGADMYERPAPLPAH
ncbi:MAG: NAD(P)-dependent oxidoreductase [Thermoplasmata archaeon]|nr:NAD(P)-dependent oxidoreductase [Thermoplasmata archaeon]